MFYFFIFNEYCQGKDKIPINYFTFGQSVLLIIIIMESDMMVVKLKLHYNIVVTNIAMAIIIKSFQFSYEF